MAASILRAAIGVTLLVAASVTIAMARPSAMSDHAFRLAAYADANCRENGDKIISVEEPAMLPETTPLTRLGLSSRPVDL